MTLPAKLCCLLASITITSAAVAQNWGKFYGDPGLFAADSATVAGNNY